MSDPAGHYTDPLEEALSQGAQRVAQLASLLGAAAEVRTRREVLKDAREAADATGQAGQVIGEQELDAYQQARMRWAPAHDPRWLAQADLLQTARAWSAAACYADTDPVAAAAMRKCEERLRTLHPYAMARYDRLRTDAMNPLAAMSEAAPLFSRPPHARTGEAAATRPALDTIREQGASPPASATPATMATPDPDSGEADQAEQRGQWIAAQLQARARASGRGKLGPDELATVLETVTNLPGDAIERITRAAGAGRHAAKPEHPGAGGPGSSADLVAAPATGEPGHEPAATGRGTRTAGAATARGTTGRTAAEIAADSFPHSVADAVSAAAGAGRSPARIAGPRQARRPGRSL